MLCINKHLSCPSSDKRLYTVSPTQPYVHWVKIAFWVGWVGGHQLEEMAEAKLAAVEKKTERCRWHRSFPVVCWEPTELLIFQLALRCHGKHVAPSEIAYWYFRFPCNVQNHWV
jgi:hypothetical protein